MSSIRLLGKGWDFPVTADAGALTYAFGPDKVSQSIWIILDTEPGERIMRPTFGAGLRRFLMQPNTSATRALIARDVEQALATFEPRIRVSEVRVDPGEEPSLVLIHIAYVHVRDQRPGNLVFPFYLE